MKKKNGFTLIELIGIIVILGVLVAIGVPSLLKTLNNNKNKEYETFEKNLFLATESYIQKHQDSFSNLNSENGSAMVSINTLVDNGLIKRSLINPKTGQKINLLDFVKVTTMIDSGKNNRYYNYQYIPSNKMESYEFAYKDDVQEFEIKKSGYYQLEVWGAQGGSVTSDSKLYEGGYGAYASGIVELSKGDILYIFTGGTGKNQDEDSSEYLMGGHNGGGAAYNIADNLVASGGGATHISQIDRNLSSYNDDEYEVLVDEALIVAAGGGGAFKSLSNPEFSANGGSGGGADGSIPWNVTFGDNMCIYPKDIKDLLDKSKPNHGLNVLNNFGSYCLPSSIVNPDFLNTIIEVSSSFGNGSVKYTNDYGNDFNDDEYVQKLIKIADDNSHSISGGGGGLLGGGLGYNTGGNGGFSYVTHSGLQDQYIACYKCDSNDKGFTYGVDKVSEDPISKYAKKGNGYAKITYLEI